MNTNNVPEHIWPDNIVADRHEVSGKWVLHYLTDEQAAKCAAAMQPQVSESDEAVAREIIDEFGLSFTGMSRKGVDWNVSEKRIAAILSRHRQPAAVSAETVEYYKRHADNFAAILQKLGSYASGWHKPYLVSEIERFKQDVAMPYLHEEERKRALSPETVCGGE